MSAPSDYDAARQQATHDPELFRAEQAAQLKWHTPPTILCQPSSASAGLVEWFPDGRLNTAWLALDAHIEDGRGEQTAIIHDSPVTGTRTRLSYFELHRQVALCAGMLRDLQVKRGDRVIIYMPMVPEAVVAMLACARTGAVPRLLSDRRCRLSGCRWLPLRHGAYR